MTLQNILKEKKGTIVDVRSPEEFMGGNVVGSINIPLQEIPQRLEELKTLNQLLFLRYELLAFQHDDKNNLEISLHCLS